MLVFATVLSLHCIDYVVENTPTSKATRALNLIHVLMYDMYSNVHPEIDFPHGHFCNAKDLHNVDLFSGKGAINSAFGQNLISFDDCTIF